MRAVGFCGICSQDLQELEPTLSPRTRTGPSSTAFRLPHETETKHLQARSFSAAYFQAFAGRVAGEQEAGRCIGLTYGYQGLWRLFGCFCCFHLQEQRKKDTSLCSSSFLFLLLAHRHHHRPLLLPFLTVYEDTTSRLFCTSTSIAGHSSSPLAVVVSLCHCDRSSSPSPSSSTKTSRPSSLRPRFERQYSKRKKRETSNTSEVQLEATPITLFTFAFPTLRRLAGKI